MPAHESFEREKNESIGEPFGFDAAHDPLAGHVCIFAEADEDCPGEY